MLEGGGGGEVWLLGYQHLVSKAVCSNLLLAYTPFFQLFFDRTRGKTNLEEKLAPWSSWKKINYNCKLKRVISILQAPLIHLGTYRQKDRQRTVIHVNF